MVDQVTSRQLTPSSLHPTPPPSSHQPTPFSPTTDITVQHPRDHAHPLRHQGPHELRIADGSDVRQFGIPNGSGGHVLRIPDVSGGREFGIPNVSDGREFGIPNVSGGREFGITNGSGGREQGIPDAAMVGDNLSGVMRGAQQHQTSIEPDSTQSPLNSLQSAAALLQPNNLTNNNDLASFLQLPPPALQMLQAMQAQMLQMQAQNQVLEAKVKEMQAAQSAGTPVQESQAGGVSVSGDASVFDASRFSQARHERPEVRMFISDTEMSPGSSPDNSPSTARSFSSARRASLGRSPPHLPAVSSSLPLSHFPEASADSMSQSLVTNLTPCPTAEWTRLHMISHPNFPEEEKMDVLWHSLLLANKTVSEQNNQLEWAHQTIHAVQTGWIADHALMETMRAKINTMEQNNQLLSRQVIERDDHISRLQTELRQLQALLQNTTTTTNNNNQLSLRPGIKRGRFSLSAPTRECANCKKVFDSEEAAKSSSCSYHLKPACDVSHQMALKVCEAGGEKMKPHYWPCCRIIDTKTPPACFCGPHCLRVV